MLKRNLERQSKCDTVVEIPRRLLARLKEELENKKWPARQRRSCTSKKYHVVKKHEAPAAIKDIMLWGDASFPYTHVAMALNFEGSPHVDSEDKCYQYVLSVGNFTGGGELCVRDERAGELHVVDSRNKLARIDGRFLHFVRGYKGTRYSVVFFALGNEILAEREQPVVVDF